MSSTSTSSVTERMRPRLKHERRGCGRLNAPLMLVRTVGSGHVLEQLVDLSREGVRWRGQHALAVGDSVRLVLLSVGLDVELPVVVEVLRSAPSTNGTYLTAARLLPLEASVARGLESLMLRLLDRRDGQRAGPRLSARATAFVRPASGGETQRATLTDVGLKGLGLAAERPPAIGESGLVSVVIANAAGIRERLSVQAVVRWSAPGGYGVELTTDRGAAFSEQTLVALADRYQRATDFHQRRPPMEAIGAGALIAAPLDARRAEWAEPGRTDVYRL